MLEHYLKEVVVKVAKVEFEHLLEEVMVVEVEHFVKIEQLVLEVLG